MTLLAEWEQAKLLGVTLEEFAQQKKVSFRALNSQLYRQRLKVKGSVSPDFKGFDRPELYDWSLPSEWEFEWDDFMVVGDVQLPTTDYDFATLPALIAKKHLKKPRRLIVAGDFFNMDVWSKYKSIVPLPTWVDEKEAARNLLTIYSQVFQEIWMIAGNHERRLLEHLDGQWDFQDVLTASLPSGHIKATVRDRCVVKTSQGKYTVLHGANYARKPLSNADEYAQKFQSHIIAHHEHHAAIGMDRWDRYYCISNGGLFDVNKMAYVQLRTNTMAGMSNGFTMVKDGYPYLFSKFTDWKKWL